MPTSNVEVCIRRRIDEIHVFRRIGNIEIFGIVRYVEKRFAELKYASGCLF